MSDIKPFRIILFFVFLFIGTTLSAQQKALPKSGEGIASFLLRHNRSPKKYYDAFIRLNQKKLGKSESLRMGTYYQIPAKGAVSVQKTTSPQASKSNTSQTKTAQGKAAKPKAVVEPLFGKRWEKVKPHSNRLSHACFYVVCGHGGPDPGAIGRVRKHELHEDEYAYDIALRLARNLMLEGATVRMIIQDEKDGIREEPYLSNSKRETCMGAPIPLSQVQRLKQRCYRINTLYQKDRKRFSYCRAIFIHVDSRSKGKQTDVFFYYSRANRTVESKRLAVHMKNMFESKYNRYQPQRGFTGTVSGRNLYVLANTKPASVFVELGNIQNAFDQRRLVISSNRQALSKWLMEGFLKDFQRKK